MSPTCNHDIPQWHILPALQCLQYRRFADDLGLLVITPGKVRNERLLNVLCEYFFKISHLLRRSLANRNQVFDEQYEDLVFLTIYHYRCYFGISP
jgi:hypothetical protein